MTSLLENTSLERLAEQGVVPPDPVCVFVSGSLVAGWGHGNSDLDVYIVTEEPALVEPTNVSRRAFYLEPDAVPISVLYLKDGRWDIEYWLERQVRQLIDKILATDLDGPIPAGADLTTDDFDFLYRLLIGRSLIGGAWLTERKAELENSRLRQILASIQFNEADGFLEDAIGQLEVGDHQSAVLSAHLAFGLVVDGLLANEGELSPSQKWRAQKMIRAQPDALAWDEYWSLQTMRELDPECPELWIRRLIERCQEIITGVSFA